MNKISKKSYEVIKFFGELNLTEKEVNILFEMYYVNSQLSISKIKSILIYSVCKFSVKKENDLKDLISKIKNEFDLRLFVFSINLAKIGTLLIALDNFKKATNIISIVGIHQLSLEYDSLLNKKEYYSKVNTALLSLFLFEELDKKTAMLISQSTSNYVASLRTEYSYLKANGLEPNQMFMLMFSESINQSILSDAGSSYEQRIYNILIGLGISDSDIKKTHDKADSSTEFDFFFELNGKTFGIGAKRTLRERYKQFIKTAQMTDIDVMIQITLGLDLTEEKAKAITNYGVVTFVSDEIYNSRKYLQSMKSIYPASQLSLKVLKNLTK